MEYLCLTLILLSLVDAGSPMGWFSIPCVTRLEVLATKMKTCASSVICYEEELSAVERTIREGCLRYLKDEQEEDGPYGRMRTYLVIQNGLVIRKGQRLKLPAVGTKNPDGTERNFPEVDVFAVEYGRVVHKTDMTGVVIG